ncbi:MAG: AAA family ATPase [Muribaculaceae bacterium]|nr:AAA family ATPase [Muribaculaceae bacterium]
MKKESKTQEKVTSAKKVKTTDAQETITLLQAIGRIVEGARDSKLSDNFMRQYKREIRLIADAYGITPRQAVLFCITLECGPYSVYFNELARFLDMNNVASLSFGADINDMIKRRILRYRDKDKDAFSVRDTVVNGLRENQAIIAPTVIVEDCDTLFEIMDTWFSRWSDNEPNIDEVVEDLLRLFKDNKEIGFAQKILDLKLNKSEMVVLTYFCHLLVNDNDNRITFSQMEWIFERRTSFKRFTREMGQGTHPLMVQEFIENICEDGQANSNCFCLTEKAKRELLAELHLETSEIKMHNLLEAQHIEPKEMFYPKAMRQQIDELNSFLDDKQFLEIQRRLVESGLRSGFACLFYGAPGTGKTETVYQLARATGRSIMVVDVPQIKSKWVGESEKNIKALFDRYRMLVKRCELAPILLFNEADAIFGVRKNGAESAVDKMENTIQNIILQEMENLQGIMIATTNLAGNLDGAFERRFLYKVRFEKPDATVRRCIWQEMIPDLSDQEAQTLADGFDLSGGQIENIARKNTINHILHGDNSDRLAILKKYCCDETIETSPPRRRMGF